MRLVRLYGIGLIYKNRLYFFLFIIDSWKMKLKNDIIIIVLDIIIYLKINLSLWFFIVFFNLVCYEF